MIQLKDTQARDSYKQAGQPIPRLPVIQLKDTQARTATSRLVSLYLGGCL